MLRRLIVLCALVLGALPATAYAAPGDDLLVTPTDSVIGANDPGMLPVDLRITPDDGSLNPLSTTWQILQDGVVVRESGTTVPATRTEATAPHRMSVDVGGLTEGRYTLSVNASWTDGSRTSHAAGGAASLTVDRSTPSVDLGATPTWLYPARDGYRDNTDLRSSASEAGSARFVIRRDATGAAVRVVEYAEASTAHAFRWWGTYASGTRVPSGYYTATVTYTDAGGSTGSASVRLNVRPEKLTWTTWTRTLTPKQAGKNRIVGSCSTIRGDVNGWTGGWGLWSNALCNGGTGDRSYVEGIFGSSVPTEGVVEYGDYSVTTVGRANGRVPQSTAIIGLYRASDGTFPKTGSLGSAYKAYSAPALQGKTAVYPSGHVQWDVATAEGNRWDIRRFTIRLEIQRLVNPSTGSFAVTDDSRRTFGGGAPDFSARLTR